MDIKTAMIIDDSEGDQLLSKMQINKFDPNIEVMQAYDGQEALDKLTSLDKQPDIIFLDINMPRMDGLEFLEHYNKCDDHGSVVVMLTSSDQKQDQETALSYGFVENYFIKLLDGKDLQTLKDRC